MGDKEIIREATGARMLMSQRDQVRILMTLLDLLEQYEAIQVTTHTTGRSAIDQQQLFAL